MSGSGEAGTKVEEELHHLSLSIEKTAEGIFHDYRSHTTGDCHVAPEVVHGSF
jgi:hypothetical protein